MIGGAFILVGLLTLKKLSEWSSSRRTVLGQTTGSGSDKDAIAQELTERENTYNNSIHLIDKKELISKYEEASRNVREAHHLLTGERRTHSISISEFEKREESLTKALADEKQYVLDLEKALCNMRSDHVEIKVTAASKLAEANVLLCSLHGQSMEIEAKVRARDAKLDEVSKRSSEIERRSRAVEDQENTLAQKLSLFNLNHEAQTVRSAKEWQDLQEGVKNLPEAEQRLAELSRKSSEIESRWIEVEHQKKICKCISHFSIQSVKHKQFN